MTHATVPVFHMMPVIARVTVHAIVLAFVIVHVTVLVIVPVFLVDSDNYLSLEHSCFLCEQPDDLY